MVVYAWLTVAASLAVWPLGAGWLYGVLAAAAGVVLLVRRAPALRPGQGRRRTPRPMALFHLSNSYLAFLFVAVAIDTFVRH